MRLICPNCGAQYEVPDDVIPENGRDVQCSNCGDTWFQKHPSQDRELAEDLGQPLDDAHWDDEDRTPDAPGGDNMGTAPDDDGWDKDADTPEARDRGADDVEASDDDWAEDNWTEGDVPEADWTRDEADEETWSSDEGDDAREDDDWEEAQTDPQPRQRELAPEVRDVLREEAGHEMQARAAETGGLETQPDLGLDDTESEASRREREARQRMARIRGLSEEDADAMAAGAGAGAALSSSASRRDLLPDIDEINSTLRRSTARGEAPDMDEPADTSGSPRKRGGFSRGFLTVVVIAVLAILLYVYADRITEAVPALGGVMEGYVSAIDTLRAWLDAQVLSVLGWLDGMSSGADPAAPMTDN